MGICGISFPFIEIWVTADLNDIAIFVKVAQLGSFSNAAQSLGMPISTVSRRITALEEELGATLLQRTCLFSPGTDSYFRQLVIHIKEF